MPRPDPTATAPAPQAAPIPEGLETVVEADMDEAAARVRAELGARGFGVLTEIDVASTLRAKLGVERRPLKILGACNPALAHRALEVDPGVALVLPCNVVLEDAGAHRTRVAVADPRTMLALAGTRSDELEALAAEATAALRQVVSAISA